MQMIIHHVSGRNIEEVVASLEEVSEVIFQWFRDKHIQQICCRASAKLKALARIVPFMNITKRKILMKAFFIAQFS